MWFCLLQRKKCGSPPEICPAGFLVENHMGLTHQLLEQLPATNVEVLKPCAVVLLEFSASVLVEFRCITLMTNSQFHNL